MDEHQEMEIDGRTYEYGGNRRGSSLFTYATADDANNEGGSNSKPGDCLLVDFPQRDDGDEIVGYTTTKATTRLGDDNLNGLTAMEEEINKFGNFNHQSNSFGVVEGVGVGTLENLKQKQHGNTSTSIKNQYNMQSTGQSSSGRLGEAARMEQLARSQNLPGGKDYRPLVGGFAAAAYEAYREHHFSRDEESPQRGPSVSNGMNQSP